MRTIMFSLTLAAASLCWGASGSDSAFAGHWNVVVSYADESVSMKLDLTQEGAHVQGTSTATGFGLGLSHEGSVQGKRLRITSFARDYAKVVSAPQSVGTIDLEIINGRLVGKGMLYGTAVTWTGVRLDEAPSAPKTYDY